MSLETKKLNYKSPHVTLVPTRYRTAKLSGYRHLAFMKLWKCARPKSPYLMGWAVHVIHCTPYYYSITDLFIFRDTRKL